jgi:hypothetical protein
MGYQTLHSLSSIDPTQVQIGKGTVEGSGEEKK